LDNTKILGDAVVIARVLEDAALRITGHPYFHEADRGLMPEQQVKNLLINMVAFVRQYKEKLDIGKPFPDAMRTHLKAPILWLVKENLTIGGVTLELLMPYIIFPDKALAEIDDHLHGVTTYDNVNVVVSEDAVISGWG
jgi:hypothetical protein